jgi:phosphatidylglycerophosphate synthase
MKTLFSSLYTITLALWTGGMAIFTLVVTPAIFRSYGRDQAGEIVGRLFPGYFLYTLALSALALILFFLLGGNPARTAYRLSLFLLTAALLVNTYITFKLHPEAVRVKHQVESFERESPDSPARREFRRLHAISAVLNLFVLADGVALLVLSTFVKK